MYKDKLVGNDHFILDSVDSNRHDCDQKQRR